MNEPRFARSSRGLILTLTLGATLCLSACTTTQVVKNPDDEDCGVRYYRPKPYLLVQPLVVKSDKGDLVSQGMVTIELKYLPDYTEEYSIHVRAGLGVNKTSIKLQDGWNLTDINIEVDSKTAENLEAVAHLVGAATKFGPSSGGDRVDSGSMTVRANNVPIGFYEAVIGRSNEGKKRLYGWRYVGFTPYEKCPADGAGGPACFDCSARVLYGLAMSGGVMTFAPLDTIARSPAVVQHTVVAPGPRESGPGAPEESGPISGRSGMVNASQLESIRAQAATIVSNHLSPRPPIPPRPEVAQSGTTIFVVIERAVYEQLEKEHELAAVKAELEKFLSGELTGPSPWRAKIVCGESTAPDGS